MVAPLPMAPPRMCLGTAPATRPGQARRKLHAVGPTRASHARHAHAAPRNTACLGKGEGPKEGPAAPLQTPLDWARAAEGPDGGAAANHKPKPSSVYLGRREHGTQGPAASLGGGGGPPLPLRALAAQALYARAHPPASPETRR